MSQEASDILRGRSLVNRHLYQQRIADTVEASFEQQQPTTYIGFDAEQGLGKLKDTGGNICYGSSQTNGAVKLGENIRLRRGGVLSQYDSMPHRKQDTPVISQNSEELEAAFLFCVEASTRFKDTSIFFRNLVFFESIQQLGYGEAANSFIYTRYHQIEPNQITYKDSFFTSFRHTGNSNFLVFGNASLGVAQILTNGPHPVKFFSPTVARIIVDVRFTPGGGTVNTSCGISVNRQVDFKAEGNSSGAILPSTCDAYSNGTNVSYETTVPAGEHFISCLGCYSYAYPIQGIYSEAISGSISITIETIAVNSFYIQKGNQVTKVEGIATERITNANGIDTTGSLVGYLTFTPSTILGHIKYAHPVQLTNQSVYRYFLSGRQLTKSRFDFPQEIPRLLNDWQQEWTNTYLPDADAVDTCINGLKNNGKRRFTNIFKNQMIAIDLNQVIKNQLLQNLIKVENVTAKVEFSSFANSGNACTIKLKRTKSLKLNKLVIPEGVDISAVKLLGVSVITK